MPISPQRQAEPLILSRIAGTKEKKKEKKVDEATLIMRQMMGNTEDD